MIKKWNQKYTKQCDNRKSLISSKLNMIYISSNNVRRPITKTFSTLHPSTLVDTLLLSFKLHPTTLHSTSLHLSILHFLSFKLRPTTLHYPLIWLNSI